MCLQHGRARSAASPPIGSANGDAVDSGRPALQLDPGDLVGVPLHGRRLLARLSHSRRQKRALSRILSNDSETRSASNSNVGRRRCTDSDSARAFRAGSIGIDPTEPLAPTRSPSTQGRAMHLDVPATLVPVSPATDLTADSAEQEEDRSNDHQDQTDRPERWEAEEEPDDQQDQSQDNHVAPPGSGGCPAQSAGSLPSRTPSKT